MEHVHEVMKTFEVFTNTITYRSSPSVHYYNSHGVWSSYREIQAIETERGNYTEEDFDEWADKYAIKPSDEVIWVTPNPIMAYRYLFPAEHWDTIVDLPLRKIKRWCTREFGDSDLYEVTSDEGFIIPESDDGEEGFIFVYRKNNK
jgi:hypothetical protein